MNLIEFARRQVREPDLQPIEKDGCIVQTFCNVFIQRLAYHEGILDLNHMATRAMLIRFTLRPDWWKEIDAKGAADLAGRGFFVVAGAHAAAPDRHDHACLVLPGPLGWSAKHQKDLPIVANVGRENFFGRLASYAFPPTMPPRFWTWVGT